MHEDAGLRHAGGDPTLVANLAVAAGHKGARHQDHKVRSPRRYRVVTELTICSAAHEIGVSREQVRKIVGA
jgi:hypothetical protein